LTACELDFLAHHILSSLTIKYGKIWAGAALTCPRVLYVSGSFGLGHITRDLAVVRELRRRAPSVEVEWLSASPTTELLAEIHETLVPECSEYRCETDAAEAVGTRGRLNLTNYVYRTLGKWIHNARTIGRAARRGAFDLIVGDETYEVIVAHTFGFRFIPNIPFLIMYDFFGLDAVSKNLFERLGAWGLNFIWTQERRIFGRGNNASLFIGELADIEDRRFGLFLPNRRRYAEKNLCFLGYIMTFDPHLLPPKEALRAELGYDRRPLIICTVGGTSVGRELLELCGRAYPLISSQVPDVRLVLVCGPRIDPDELEVPKGVERRGMVADLYRHFTCADLVITQGGGTTTLELTALRVPFIFFPVKFQSEQEITIANRLARHQAGLRMSLSETTPNSLAAAVANQIGKEASYPPIPCQGAARAAEIILERLLHHTMGSSNPRI
jgi:UDP:flavonoid glycosyltransferase YjiC (YdhE family)